MYIHRPVRGTFGGWPLKGGGVFNLNGQMPLKNMRIQSQWPLILIATFPFEIFIPKSFVVLAKGQQGETPSLNGQNPG